VPSTRRTRGGGRPARISRAAVVAAAIEIIDAEGLDALTMRRVGEHLGVAAMSLYRHVDGRAPLLAAVVDELVSRVLVELAPGTTWPVAVTRLAAAYRSMLLAHPHAVPLLAVHPVDVETGLGLMSGVLARFAAAGIDQDQALTVVQTVVVFTLGHALAEVGVPPGSAPTAHSPADRAYYERWFAGGLDALVRGFGGATS
jgi:TetR/AcrR family tetracycline transcriptional repressor